MTAPARAPQVPARHGGRDGALDALRPWRRALHAVAGGRALLAGGGVAALTLALGSLLHPVARGEGGLVLWVAVVAGLVVAVATWWRAAAHALTHERTALWIEEQEPRLRFALVTALGDEIAPPVRDALERAIGTVHWQGPARAALWRALRGPAAVATLGLAALFILPPLARHASTAAEGPASRSTGAPAGAALGALQVELVPPPYTGLAIERWTDPAMVRAYPGSRVRLRGLGGAAGVRAARDSLALAVEEGTGGWRAEFGTGAARALVRVERVGVGGVDAGRQDGEPGGGDARLLAIEPLVDSAPTVTLRLPVRDTVLRVARGRLDLAADVHDDLAIAGAAFEYIVSSGAGERFTFRSGRLGALSVVGGRSAALRATLSLDSMGLAPGDVMHLRAVARDRNVVSGPGVGTSESRTIRIARADEYDSVAVDQAPPPEVDKSLLSQRMLITMTEALVRRARTLERNAVTAESRRIGRDQARLRKQVSDIIFARLGDGAEGAGEHFHGDGHGHDESESLRTGPLSPEALLKAAEKATQISGSPTDFEHDETPVVAINRPMLEAYNAMWEAGRELEGGEPARALPPMYRALAAIQRARAAERLYLRGAPPRVVVDLARVRLQGKDTGTPAARLARPARDSARGPLLARFGRAVDALATPASAGAGIDSLIVLRLAVADRLPAAAQALEAAIGALRASRVATEELRRARRALDDALVAGDSLPAWGRLP